MVRNFLEVFCFFKRFISGVLIWDMICCGLLLQGFISGDLMGFDEGYCWRDLGDSWRVKM